MCILCYQKMRRQQRKDSKLVDERLTQVIVRYIIMIVILLTAVDRCKMEVKVNLNLKI